MIPDTVEILIIAFVFEANKAQLHAMNQFMSKT